MTPTDQEGLARFAHKLRQSIVVMNCHAGSGHPGGALSAVEVVSWLFARELRIDPAVPEHPLRDRFVLSKGHACMVLYAALAEVGYFPHHEFVGLRHTSRMLQGHPDRLTTPGVEFSSGSLGQGFSFALGTALGGRLRGDEFRVAALLGDGELNEGQVWEGFMFGAFHRLDNLVAVVDYNDLQSDCPCDDVTALSPVVPKLQAFGWHVVAIDGHDLAAVAGAFHEARATRGKPTAIVARTTKGQGVSFMAGAPKWHGSLAPTGDLKARAFSELAIDEAALLAGEGRVPRLAGAAGPGQVAFPHPGGAS